MHDRQLHWLKAVHADHHPGNYLFRPDGGIGLVDFGSVKHLGKIAIHQLCDYIFFAFVLPQSIKLENIFVLKKKKKKHNL